MPHKPIMINRNIMTDLQSHFETYYNVTSSHKKRQKNDMQFEFSYVNWLLEAPKSELVTVDQELYKSSQLKTNTIFYMPFWTDMKKNTNKLEEFEKKKDHIKFMCINDLMDHTDPKSTESKKELMIFYNSIYPNKSQFEL